MKVLGIITEYNPFHNGHVYHLSRSKAITGADRVICVMSGNFVQRGEPAVINKWARTQIALASGADLVIELPAVFATASAEYFAFGAVKLLDSLGITDFICFGSEAGSIEALENIASILIKEPEQYKAILKDSLATGISFPAAREKALSAYIERTGGSCPVTISANILGQSNNILGIEYIKALKKLKSKIRPVTLGRISNTYNATELTGAISSATAVRNLILSYVPAGVISLTEELGKVMPEYARLILMDEIKNGRGPVTLDLFDSTLLTLIRKTPSEQISKLPYIAEGLENRIKSAADNSGGLSELLDKICTRRYTRTRIQRALISMFTGIKSVELDTFMKHGGPQYIRILGFNKNGRELLSFINRTASLPVIIKTADFKNSCNPLLARMLEIEAEATDMYVLAYKNSSSRKGGQEYTANLIRT